MSVVIRGMKMPTSCSECSFCGYYGKGDHVCDITGKEVVYELSLENRLDDCPIVELPPHGRLIDADALMERFSYSPDDTLEDKYWIRAARRIIIEAPTIIEPEEVQDGTL